MYYAGIALCVVQICFWDGMGFGDTCIKSFVNVSRAQHINFYASLRPRCGSQWLALHQLNL